MTDWLGAHVESGSKKQLAGNGERVIGIHGRKGIYVRALGLVIQKSSQGPQMQP